MLYFKCAWRTVDHQLLKDQETFSLVEVGETLKVADLWVSVQQFVYDDIRSISFLVPSCTGSDVKEAQVICVSTGTKCINGEYMSDRGLALNDCHAEIVARRSLIRYLYSQLEHFLR